MADVQQTYRFKFEFDRKDVKKQLKEISVDVKDAIAQMGDASDKVVIFKELVSYLSNVDKALEAFKNNHKDDFSNLFGNPDKEMLEVLTKIFNTTEQSAQAFVTLREKIASAESGKADLKTLRGIAEEINALFVTVGQASRIDIAEMFSGKGSKANGTDFAGRIKLLNDTLNEFGVTYSGWQNKLKGGFGSRSGGGFGGNIESDLDELKKIVKIKVKEIYDELTIGSQDYDKIDSIQDALKEALDFSDSDFFEVSGILGDLLEGDIEEDEAIDAINAIVSAVKSGAQTIQTVVNDTLDNDEIIKSSNKSIQLLKQQLKTVHDASKNVGNHELGFAVDVDGATYFIESCDNVVKASDEAAAAVRALNENITVIGHTHPNGGGLFSADDYISMINQRRAGITSPSMVMGDKYASVLNLANATEDVLVQIENVLRRHGKKGNDSVGFDVIKEMQDVFSANGMQDAMQTIRIADGMDELAESLYHIGSSANTAQTPLQKLQALIKYYSDNKLGSNNLSEFNNYWQEFESGAKSALVVFDEVMSKLGATDSDGNPFNVSSKQYQALGAALKGINATSGGYGTGDVSRSELEAAENAALEAQRRAEEAESDSLRHQEAANRLLEEKFALEEENESLKERIAQQELDDDELSNIQRENGALEDKLEILREIADTYGVQISQKDRNRYEELSTKEMEEGLTSREEDRMSELSEKIDEADANLLELEQTYDRITLKLSNGKKVEILPDDDGLRKLYKISDSLDNEYNGFEIEDVIFERKQEQAVIDETNQKLLNQEQLWDNISTTIKTVFKGSDVPGFAMSLDNLKDEILDVNSELMTAEQCAQRFVALMKEQGVTDFGFLKEDEAIREWWDRYQGNAFVNDGQTVVNSSEYNKILIEREKLLERVSSLQSKVNGMPDEYFTVGEFESAMQEYCVEVDRLQNELAELKVSYDLLKDTNQFAIEDIVDYEREITNLHQIIDDLQTKLRGITYKSESVDDGNNSMTASSEIAQLETLQQKLLEVKSAVDAKTQAFEEEYVTVDAAVDAEIASLNKLKELLQEIQGILQIVFAVSDQNIGDVNISGNKIDNGSAQQAVQGIQQTLSQILAILQGFTGIESNGKNSITHKESTAKSPVNTSDVIDSLNKKFDNIATENTLAKIPVAIDELADAIANKTKGETDTHTNTINALDTLISALNSNINSLKEVMDGVAQHQKTQKSDTVKAMTRIQDPNQRQDIVGWAKDAVKSYSEDVEIESLQALSNGLVKVEGAFKNVNGEWEGFTVKINESNKAVDLAIKKHSTFAKTLSQSENAVENTSKFSPASMITVEAKHNTLTSKVKDGQFTNSAVITASLEAYEEAYSRVRDMYRDLNSQGDPVSDDQKIKFKELTMECNEYANALDKLLVSSQKSHETKYNKTSYFLDAGFDYSDVEQRKKELSDFAKAQYDVSLSSEDFKKNFSEATFAVKNSDGTFTQMTARFTEARNEIVAMAGDTKKSQSIMSGFLDGVGKRVKSLAQYVIATISIYDVWRTIKQGVQYVREIDSALTELKKVTDETDAGYRRFLQTASQAASEIGGTVANFVDATADFARLGYNIEQAASLAKAASVYKNVGDGITDIAAASESIISTMKAFGIEANDAMTIVDRFNEVGNNFAISSTGIGEAMQRSASALYEAGNTIDESIALITGANSVIQNPEQVGTALKTLALRLRGAKVELEEAGEDVDGMAESTSQLQAKLKALTHGKVDIMIDANTFKNTTQILREMASAWEDMTDIERASALELMGGKRQANILASVIKNFDTVEDVIATSMDSSGSAIAENEKYLTSIQGRIDLFNSSIQTMWMNFIDSDAVKFFVDLGSAAIKLVDTLGLLPTAIGAFSAFKIATKEVKSSLDIINKAIQDTVAAKQAETMATQTATAATEADSVAEQFNTNMKNANAAAGWKDVVATNAQTVATKALAVAKGVLTGIAKGVVIMLASQVIGKAFEWIYKSIDQAVHRAEYLKEEVEELQKTYEDAKKTFGENLTELTTSSDTKLYETLQDEFAALTKGVDKYGNNISLTADQYERYKEICEKIVGINPAIAAGYDSATKAIGNNASALERLIDVQDRQARRVTSELIKDENLDKIAVDALNNVNSIRQSGSAQVTSEYMKLREILFGSVSQELQQYLTDTGKTNAHANGDRIRLILEKIGINNATSISQSYWNQALGDYNFNQFMIDYFDEIQANTDKFGDEYVLLLNDTIYKIDQANENYQDDLAKARDGLLSTLLEVPYSIEGSKFGDLNASSQKFIIDWIKNSDIFKIDPHMSEDAIKEQIKSNKNSIIDLINGMSNETTQAIFDEIDSIDPSKVSQKEYLDLMKGYTDQIWNAIGGKDNKYGFSSAIQLEKIFGVEYAAKGLDSSVTALSNYLGSKYSDVLTSVMNNLSKKQYDAFLNIDWNLHSEDVNSWKDVINIINAELKDLDVTASKTYSVLVESIESYNEVLAQTKEIVSDNTLVTEEYKESLKALGISEEELNECFDENNKLVVKDANALNKLVKAAKNNTTQNIKLAKAQARLEYYELYKEINSLTGGIGKVDDATMGYINSLLKQMNVLQRTIAKYSLLEAELLGTANAYQELADAQAADEAADYGSKAEELVNVLGEAFNTAQLGTNAARVAIEGLIPPEVFEDADTLDERMQKIYEYFTKGKISQLFTIGFDDEGMIESVEMTRENIEKFTNSLIGTGEDAVFQGSWDEFTLNPAIKSMEDFQKATGLTKELAFAFLTELEKYDIGNIWGNGDSLLDQLMGDNLDYQLQKAIEIAAEVERKLAEGTIKATDKDYIDATADLEAHEEQALADATAWQKKQQEIEKYKTELKKYQDELAKLPNGADQTELRGQIESTAIILDNLMADLREMSEPTEFVINVAASEAKENIAEFKESIDELYKQNDAVAIEVKPVIEQIDKNGLSNLESMGFKKNQEGKWIATGEAQWFFKLDEDSQVKILQYIDMLEQEHLIDVSMGADTPTVEDHLGNIAKILEDIAKLLDPTYSITVETSDAESKTSAFKSMWDDIKSKSVTLTTTFADTVKGFFTRTPKEGDGADNVNGNANFHGTANAGGTWGAPKTETSLVGELGPELLVRGNRWTTVGDNGAEFTQVRKGDIIFNHRQTEELLKNGHITSRGKAYANGSVHTTGVKAVNFDGGVIDTWGEGVYIEKQYNNIKPDLPSSKVDTWNGSNNGSGSGNDVKDIFEEVFDWIEVRLEEINEDLDLMNAKLENAVGYVAQNSLIDEIIAKNEELYRNLLAGADEYNSYAQTLLAKIPEKYREMAQDGSISIEQFKDAAGSDIREEQLEAIREYREWVQKGADATQQAEEVLTEISNLAKQAFDNIVNDFDNQASLIDSKISQYEAHNDLLETDKGFASEEIYKAIQIENEAKKKLLEAQRDAMKAELDTGKIKEGTDAWYEAVNAITEVDAELINIEAEIENIQDSINELHWAKFDLLIKQFQAVSDEAQNLLDILGTKDAVDEFGNWTDEGVTSLGLLAQQMEEAEMAAAKYQEEIKYLEDNWEELGYTQEEYVDKLEELKSGQYDAIDAYHDAKDAIIELNEARVDAIKDGIEKEIDAYEKLIDAKKEALDAERDLYDFQKSIEEKSKNIADIERKLAALEYDNSASARAQKAKLQAELAEAQAELEDAYYDRSVDNQQEALDKELEHFQETKEAEIEGWEKYLENMELVVADSLAMVQANTQLIFAMLTAIGQQYGLDITNALTQPWMAGETAIQDYGVKLGISITELASMFGLTVDEFAAKLGLTTEMLVSNLDITGAQMAENLDLTNEQLAAKLGLTVTDLSSMMGLTIQELAANMGITIPALAEKLGTTTAGLAGNLDMTMAQFAGRMGLTVEDLAGKFGISVESLADRLGMTYQELMNPFGLSMSATVDALKNLEKEYRSILDGIQEDSIKTVDEVNNAMDEYQKKQEEQTKPVDTGNSSSAASTVKSEKDYYGVALAVWNGGYGWGNGNARRERLTAKGFDPDKVQQIINKMGKDGYIHSGAWKGKYNGIKDLAPYHFNKFAKGTTGVNKDQWAIIDELGDELVMHAAGGKLAFLSKGSAVIPHDISENLMELGSIDPQDMLERNKPSITAPHIVNNEININMEIAEVVHIDHVDHDTLPDLTKAVKKEMDSYMTKINNAIRSKVR
jgi:TP901 family phage tail tape measure protein